MDPRLAALMQMQQQQQGQGQPMPMPQQQQPMPMPMSEPPPTIPDQMTDEDMLNSVSDQMGGAENEVRGEDMRTDQAAVEAAPTDGNISAFVEMWGEENLPPSMKNPDADGDDYAMGD